jgi:hypothetical protein
MIVHAAVICCVVQALIRSYKKHHKTRETYTNLECRSRLYRWAGPRWRFGPQDEARLDIFTPEIIMYGIITQEYNRIQSTLAFCPPNSNSSYAILWNLATLLSTN